MVEPYVLPLYKIDYCGDWGIFEEKRVTHLIARTFGEAEMSDFDYYLLLLSYYYHLNYIESKHETLK